MAYDAELDERDRRLREDEERAGTFHTWLLRALTVTWSIATLAIVVVCVGAAMSGALGDGWGRWPAALLTLGLGLGLSYLTFLFGGLTVGASEPGSASGWGQGVREFGTAFVVYGVVALVPLLVCVGVLSLWHLAPA